MAATLGQDGFVAGGRPGGVDVGGIGRAQAHKGRSASWTGLSRGYGKTTETDFSLGSLIPLGHSTRKRHSGLMSLPSASLCSRAKATRIRSGSLQAVPTRQSPTGSPPALPTGKLIAG